ncbi:hypothetical protein [Mangrovibrevibacter kandeliae]|uniref:hypothetical protein n=1 Tax=Mangrovibrevibacter kandeliae TaxID=2968473 RepID=UPI0021178DD7|nr:MULTISPECIES: hypothetical protein [unclassified Aurantimonas]MCQ8780943.1 hypothetical protein [Aurantimonas sp. CSK15Z-1]MCW4113724.1 hypothetical protein [Aurantimonas sp. MSK8Z-1]
MEPVLMQAIGRLEAVLVQETAALKSGSLSGLADTTGRKNQSLLELSRISRNLKPDVIGPELRGRLGSLRLRIEENQSALRLHVGASEEIANLIARAIEAAESDGTYGDGIQGVRRGA